MTKKFKSLGAFLFFLLMIGLVVLAGQSSNNQPSAQVLAPEPTFEILDTSTALQSFPSDQADNQALLVLVEQSGVRQVVRIEGQSKDRKVLFTDGDENLKIKQVGTMSFATNEVLVVMGSAEQQFGGSLWAIATDGSGAKRRLIEEFASPWPPALSSDGQKIAYVFYSNAEQETGFSLVIARRDGSNKRELVRETTSITQPVFSPDGQKIAYFRGDSIMVVDILGQKSQEFVKLAGLTPYDLAWGPDNQFAFVDGTNDAARLFVLTDPAAEPSQVAGPGSISRPVFSRDGHHLAFMRLENSVPSIQDLDRTTNQITTYGGGLFPIAWVSGRTL